MRAFFKTVVVTIITWLARATLRKYKPRVVAVTGSVGKTSTKDAVYAVMAKRYHIRKSEKSFNSEVGIPLTILGAPNGWDNPFIWLLTVVEAVFRLLYKEKYPEWLVLEVGADRPGDIRSLVGWLSVDVAVITRLPEVPVHVEFFDSPEAVIEEKAALIDALKPGGALVLYADDKRTAGLAHRLPAPDAKVVMFGFDKEADVRGEHFAVMYETGRQKLAVGMRADITVGDVSAPVEVAGTVGKHAFLPAIAAAAVGNALEMNLEQIAEGLGGYEAPPGRMRLLPGIKETLIIDDTYNSSPAAVAAGLETLSQMGHKSGGRRIAVLGDMLELGRHSVDEHRKAGAQAAQDCDLLLTVGFRARDIAQAALDGGLPDANIFQYEDAQKAGKELESQLSPGDVVLVKGSQSVRMERTVEEVMLEPERAGELLVRQDAEWKKR